MMGSPQEQNVHSSRLKPLPPIVSAVIYRIYASIRRKIVYLGKPEIAPDSIIRRAAQIMDRPAQFFGEQNEKHTKQKLFLDEPTRYFCLILEKSPRNKLRNC